MKTNISFLQGICRNTAFQKAELNTHFLEEQEIILKEPDYEQALFMAVAYDYLQLMNGNPLDNQTIGFQIHLKGNWIWRYIVHEALREVRVSCINNTQCQISLDGQQSILTARLQADRLMLQTETCSMSSLVDIRHNTLTFHSEHGPARIDRYTWQTIQDSSTQKSGLTAPMPATVVAILKNTGDTVKAGEGLMVLEAMKMEHTIHAPIDGVLKAVFYDVGAQVSEGVALLELDE